MASIIFDFDGTLADTFPLLVDISYTLSPGTKRVTDAEVEKLRHLPLLTALLRLGIPLYRIPHLIRWTRRSLTDRMDEVVPYKDMAPALKALHQAGNKLFILSSNYPKNVQLFLRHHHLQHYFDGVEGVYWGNSWVKAAALRRLIRKYSLDPAACYHVGNEALDIRAAKRAGLHGIAVTWSGYDVERLQETRPFALVNAPRDLVRAIAA